MASDEVLDFAQLTTPIPGDNPAGVDLREDLSHDSIYRRIKTARSDARQKERSAVFEEADAEAEAANWGPILELAPKAIAEHSKDLEIVAFLTEALVRRHGYAGLRDGFRLAVELIEQFWDHLYPLPDEEGMITRVAPLAGLNGEESDGLLVGPITKVPVTQGGTVGPYAVVNHRWAVRLEGISDPEARVRQAEQPGAVTLEMFSVAVRETSDEFFQNLWEDMTQCSGEFEKLCELLEQKCGKDESGYSLAPPSSNIRRTLDECRQTLQGIAEHVLGPDEEDEADDESTALQTTVDGGVPTQVHTREEAFRALQRAADFFRRTEPHSPVSYALEQAVRWGKMPLPDLLSELIPEESVREQLFKLVGIRPPQQEEG